ncbi:MAG: hypothetical protein AAF135_26580 [Bacteroidota bacterium]
MRQLTILLINWTCFSACKRNVDPTEDPPKSRFIFAEYFIRYLEPESEIKAHASFYEGDTLNPSEPKTYLGGVIFQGNKMKARELTDNSIRYTITTRGKYREDFLFQHRDDEGNHWEYEIQMSPIKDFFIKDDIISKSDGMTLVVNGGLLTDEESLVLLFTDEDNKASSLTIEGPSNSIEHFITPESLETLTPGFGQLYLVKKQAKLVAEDYLRAVSEIEYYSKILPITVSD